MTTQAKDEIIAKIVEAENIIKNYLEKTNEILSTDIDETLDEILVSRADMLERLGLVKSEIGELSARYCDEVERGYVDSSIHNRHIPLGVSAEIKEIRRAAVKMHSSYNQAIIKDSLAVKRVDARVKELRANLEELNDDKRKIDFYAHNKIGASKGGSFNTKL